MASRLQDSLTGRYALERELGRGGMATVYLAHDLRHERPVALKVLHPELAEALGPERFLREIRLAARLSHPHLLPVFDSGEAAGQLWYTMPYVEGETLRQRLTRERQLPLEDALRIAGAVAEALSYAHRHGVVHRDIKPENILLTEGHALLADFGMAWAISATGGERLTQSGLAVGTPAYMSPEQAAGEQGLDGRADLYSLGCVLYEMLAGHPPFLGGTAHEILARHALDPVPPLRRARPDLPERVERAVTRALAKVSADRFGSAKEFAQALEAIGTSADAPVERPQRTTSRLRRRAGGAAAGAVLLGLGMLLARSAGPEPREIGVVILPLSAPSYAAPFGSESVRAYQILAGGLAGLPGLRPIDGRELEPAAEAGTRPAPDLVRRARQLGGGYLIAGSVGPTPDGWEVGVEVLDLADRSVVLSAGGPAAPDSLEAVVDRVALRAIRAVVERESLALGAKGALLRATTSARALGSLLEGQTLFWVGDYEGAAAAFRSAVAADSGCELAYHRWSVAETWRHDYAAALAAVDAGLAAQERLGARWLGLLEGQRYYVMREGDSAIAAFERVLLDDRASLDGWLGLGESFFHYGPVVGHPPSDALPALERVVALDSAFAPIYDHLVDLALLREDSAAARRYLARMRAGQPWQAAHAAAIALWFGPPQVRRETLRQLATADRATLSQLVTILLGPSPRPALADTVANYLTREDRSPDDRRRGGQFRLAALAGQDRWDEALAAWRAEAGNRSFDGWIVHAALAGLPATELAAPMFAWARGLLAQGRPPDLSLPLSDDARQALFALVHVATVAGDSSEVLEMLRRIDAAPPGADPTDPTREMLRASLEGRLALLEQDTARALRLLERSVVRRPENFTAYYPLVSMAPQRLLLAEIALARGDRQRARQWLSSFGHSRAIGDVIYRFRVARLAKQLSG